MLISHTTSCYHKRVPIQVGSCIIDQVTNCITEEELQTLSQSWKLAYVSTIISKSSQVSDQEFDLEQVKCKVVITKEVKIPTFQTMITEGLTKVTGHQNHVHVLVELSPRFMSIFVPGNTTELLPGELSVTVVLRNLSGREVILEPHTEVCIATAANTVSSIQIPNEPDMGENEKIQFMSVQAVLSKETHKGLQNQKIFCRRLIYQESISGIPRCNRKLGI